MYYYFVIAVVCLPAKVNGQNNTCTYQVCHNIYIYYIYVHVHIYILCIYINRTYYIATMNSFARAPCTILFLVYLLLTRDYGT